MMSTRTLETSRSRLRRIVSSAMGRNDGSHRASIVSQAPALSLASPTSRVRNARMTARSVVSAPGLNGARRQHQEDAERDDEAANDGHGMSP